MAANRLRSRRTVIHSSRNAGEAGRRLELVVSEQRLNRPNIGTALEQMVREAMTKRVQRDRPTQPRCFRCLFEQPPELAPGQLPMFTATGKQASLACMPTVPAVRRSQTLSITPFLQRTFVVSL